MRSVAGREVEADLVDDLFPSRWSGRAMSGERVPDEEFAAMLEAARWAPSSNNEQTWRVLYATQGDPGFETMLGLLTGANPEWAQRASHLALFLAEGRDGAEPGLTQAFDTGAAWMSLALQGTMRGFVVHPMGGFKKDEALAALGVPAGYAAIAIVAIGRPGDASVLPERLRDRESSRSPRRPVADAAARGAFPQRWKR